MGLKDAGGRGGRDVGQECRSWSHKYLAGGGEAFLSLLSIPMGCGGSVLPLEDGGPRRAL